MKKKETRILKNGEDFIGLINTKIRVDSPMSLLRDLLNSNHEEVYLIEDEIGIKYWEQKINTGKKHIALLSGGHSSALVAIEVVRRFGKENVILLNHDINANVEDQDIKRFKKEIANYLGLPITYKNYQDLPVDELPDQFEVCEATLSFVNTTTRQSLCTAFLKTVPFTNYLKSEFPDKNCIIYYGFDPSEYDRIEKRATILIDMGYSSDYPLALWGEGNWAKFRQYFLDYGIKNDSILDTIFKYDLKLTSKDNFDRTIFSTKEIGIEPPNTYSNFKHANCEGCLKAGQQHWYVVYCFRKDIFDRAKLSEERIGYSIIKGYFLKDLEDKFEKMKQGGIEASEHIPFQTFWAKARKYLKMVESEEKPCECVF